MKIGTIHPANRLAWLFWKTPKSFSLHV